MTRTKKILQLLTAGVPMTSADLAVALEVDREAARKAIAQLVNSGCIKCTPRLYEITPRGLAFSRRKNKTPAKKIRQVAERRRIKKLAAQLKPDEPNHLMVGGRPNSVFARGAQL